MTARTQTEPALFTRRQAYVLVGTVLDVAAHQPTDDDKRPVAVCAMLPSSGVGVPVASAAMDGVKPASVLVASNKCTTVMTHDCNTAELATYDAIDVAAAQGAYSQFCPWDGGIKVYDSQGTFVCALAVSGRSALGDRILAVKAAHQLGYRTDFNEEGLAGDEAWTKPASISVGGHD